MNKKIINVMLITFLITFDLLAQTNWGPNFTTYRRDIYKVGTNAASSTGLKDLNEVIFIGKESLTIWDRGVYQWDISAIPDGSDILSAHLYFTYSKDNHTYELSADLFNITYDIISENYFEDIYNQMDDTQYRIESQYNGASNEFDYVSNDQNAAFNQAIKNSLANDKFVLGLKWFNDHYPNVTTRIWNVTAELMTLQISYAPPIKSVTIDQRNSLNQQVGLLKKWESDTKSWSNNFNPGSSFQFPVGPTQTILGDQNLISNQKFNNWNGLSDVTNHHIFLIENSTDILKAYLNPTYSGVLIKNSIDGTDATGGKIIFKDPGISMLKMRIMPISIGIEVWKKLIQGSASRYPLSLITQQNSLTEPTLPTHTRGFSCIKIIIFLDNPITPYRQ